MILPKSTHVNARDILIQAWNRVFPGEAPTLGGLQIAAAVAILESTYGKACYKNEFSGETFCGTHNWGAIQGSKVDPSKGMAGGFLMSDFDSTTGKKFEAQYQIYTDDVAGAAALLHLLDFYAPDAFRIGDIDGTSLQMYIGEPRGGTLHDPKGYYGGFHTIKGKEGQARIDAAMANVNDHRAKVEKWTKEVAEALDEPLEAVRGGSSADNPFSGLLSQPLSDTEPTGSPDIINDPDADELYEPTKG